MNQLTPQQTELIERFQSFTGEPDEDSIVRVLTSHNWDLDTSVTEYLYEKEHGPTTTTTVHRPTGWVSWLWSTGWHALEYVIPAPAAEIDPVTASNKFIGELELHFGRTHPQIIRGTFQNACTQSKNEHKFLIVYLHSPMHQSTSQFCRSVLCTELISDFFNDNFLFWAGSITFGETFKVANMLGASTYPFMAVICNNNINGSSMTLMDRIEGPIGQDDLMARLASVLENHGPFLLAAQLEQEERNTDRRIREEQDEEFLRSLREDQERERMAREEEARLQQERELEEQEQLNEMKKVEERKRRKELAGKRVPDEPLPGDKSSTMLVIRHVDGSRLQRRFRATDKLQAVFDYIESQPIEMEDFELLQNFPRKVFSDPHMTLADAGLMPQAALFVQEKIQE